ncbi:hypothetical protein FOB22_001453 [Saccharomyces cerevisiae]|nr:hypothetical protein FOB22_001453 [Saccharomyces cerevisiae]
MDINELKRSEDLSRGLSSYPTRMFNLIKEKSKVPLGTNATTTASINVRTNATTTESTNSSTSATTTASINGCSTINISAETGVSFGADFGGVVVTTLADLANVEVLAADDTRVPLYMLMVAVHKELDSDDVPDGRFDILLCRDSSREVGE